MAYEKNNKLHIVAVVAVIRNSEGKYLLLKRSEREVAYPGMYTFPGGKMEDNNTVEETLRREVQEECGLTLTGGKILLKDKSFVRPDGQTVKVFSYLCFVEASEPVVFDANDFTDHRWVTVDEVDSLQHVGLKTELEQAEKILSLGVPLSDLFTLSIEG